MNSTLKIEINGVLIVGRIDGIDQFTISYRQNDDDGTVVKSFTSELTFWDDGYNILKTNLIDDPLGFNNKLPVKIYDDCCGELVFEGFIKGDSIDWCDPECSISASVVEEDQELACIKNTLIWDNTSGFLNQNYNRVDYCVENRPQFIHAVVLFFGLFISYLVTFLTFTLIPALTIIVFLISAICAVVSIFGGPPCQSPVVTLDNIITTLTDQIKAALIPCTDYHVGPYVRQYIQNACNKCGIGFQSSILNDPSSIYYDLTMLSMQVKKGRDRLLTNNRTLINDNLPVETLETLLNNYLNKMFNAKWRILGGTLYFERKDYFNGIAQWIDADQLLSDGLITENKICWTWQDRQRYSYGRYEYQMDAMEYIGNEAKLQYNDLVEWNPTGSTAQSGELSVLLNASPVRCIGDQYGEIVSIFALGNQGNQMLMAQHTAFNYKFILYSGNPQRPIRTNYSDAFMVNVPSDMPQQSERFNYPMWFVEGDPITGNGAQNNLYSLFHYIDDPRLPTAQQYDFQFTFEFDCSQFQSFGFEKYIKISRGPLTLTGQIKEISVDFNRRTIQVKGSA